jgi:glycosyltransferase involved in cell wall biosynthesis
MKILFFTTNFYPYAGGLENYVLNLSEELVKRGIQADVLTFNPGNLPETESYRGINIYRIPAYNVLGKTYSFPKWNQKTKKILKELKDKKYDYVNTQTRFFLSTLLGGWFARKNRIRWIHTEHGNTFVKHKNKLIQSLAWAYDQTFGRWVFERAWKVIGISKPCCNFAIKMGAYPKKVYYIPNSIDISKFKKVKANLKLRLNIPKANKVITFVGRLIYAKGVQDLINACTGLPNITLLMVGDGPYREELEKLAKENGVKAFFLGTKNQKEVIEILSITDLFVNPSYSEGLPTSVLEAAAMGIPIIATDVGGTKEIIDKESGILVAPGKTKEIERSLEYLLANPIWRNKLAQKAYSNVRQKFDLSKNIRTYLRKMFSL